MCALGLGLKNISQVGKSKCENEQEDAQEANRLCADHKKGAALDWPQPIAQRIDECSVACLRM